MKKNSLLNLQSHAKWSLAGILLIAALLRFLYLDYGIGSEAKPHSPYNGDEVYSMVGVSSMIPEKLYFNPISGHREGSVGYNLWMSAYIPLHTIGYLQAWPHATQIGDVNYSKALLAGRAVVVLADILTVLFTFLIVLKITASVSTATLAGGLVAILPYEIFLAQEMRPHAISAFWMYLLIFLTISIYENINHLKSWAIYGAVSSLATATRYHMGLSLLIPIFYLLYEKHVIKAIPWKKIHKSLFSPQIGIFLSSAICTFFIVDPYLFLEFNKAVPDLNFQSSFASTSQFKGLSIFDLSRLGSYLIYGFPYGAGPILSVIFYVSLIYVFFLKKYRNFTRPLIIFFFVFFFIIVKIYYFIPPLKHSIRAITVLFPLLSIFTAIAVQDLLYKWRQKTIKKILLYFVVGTGIVSALWMDGVYINSLTPKNDPNSALYSFFEELQKKTSKPIKLGYWSSSRNYATPQVQLLESKHLVTLIDLHIQTVENFENTFLNHTPEVDYFLISNLYFGVHQLDPDWIVPTLIQSGKFQLIEVFERKLEFFGISAHLNIFNRPLDYPFPLKLFLLKRISS